MDYNRLIAFGCSMTFGHGLKDCYNVSNRFPSTIPSIYAWPNKLADLLEIDVVINKADSGVSNKYIWHEIVNFKYEPTDIVFVCWTYSDRTCIIDGPDVVKEINNIGPWRQHDKKSMLYYNHVYDEYDSVIDTNLRVHHSNYIVTNKNIKIFHTTIDDFYFQATWNDVQFLQANILQEDYPKALDGTHPGEEGHQSFANKIFKEIQGRI